MLSLAFCGIAGRLVFLQVLEAPAYAQKARQQRERVVEFPARRGAIFDRNGKPLALSVERSFVYTDPAFVKKPAAAAEKLARVLDIDAASLAAKLDGTEPGDRFEYLARQVSPGTARRVRALHLPGVYLDGEPRRYYPGGRLASHVLGFAGLDGEGLAGIELQYEPMLRGAPGRMVVEQDRDGRELPQTESVYSRAIPGRSLLLTLDKEIQYFTELTLERAVRRYRAAAATAVVMDPNTGDLLALANTPDFDPNDPARFSGEAQRNRALTDMYEPGSAFKVVTLAAALDEGVVTPSTSLTVSDSLQVADRELNDSHEHATESMTVAEIVQQSSNVGTARLGMAVGRERLDHYIRRFGFGSRTGLDFPGESAGIVLDVEDWSGSTIATVPIGQGIAVTSVQMAAAYAAIANGGVWVEPKIVAAQGDGAGHIETSPPAATRRVVSRATAAQVADILRGAVQRGTGMEARIPGFDVAGKTGTAQKPLPRGGYGKDYVASFAGFAPADRPAVVVLVVLDEPTPIWGGSTAAPTFREIAGFALRQLGVRPSRDVERSARRIRASQAGRSAVHD